MRAYTSSSEPSFMTYLSGGIGTSYERGYVYSSHPLAAHFRDDGSLAVEYSAIQGGWYLYTYTDP